MIDYYVQQVAQMAMFYLTMAVATYGWLAIGGLFSLCIGVPVFLTQPWRD